jgi:hypothetical protein
MTPGKAAEWLEENMVPYYPIGEFKFPGNDGSDQTGTKNA